MIKKFTTFLLAFAIVLSISTPKSSAAGGAIGTVVGSVAKYTLGAVTTELVLRAAQDGLETFFSKPQTKAFVEDLIAEGIFSLTDYFAAGYTDQDIYDQFTNYNAQLETDLGTTIIGSTADGPVVVMRLPVRMTVAPYNFSSVTTSESGAFDYSFTGTQTNRDGIPYVRIEALNFVIPFATSGSTYYILGTDNFPSRSFTYGNGYYLRGSYTAGSTIPVGGMNYGGYTAYSDSSYFPASLGASGSVYGVFSMPKGQSIPTTQNIANVSRPTTLVTPIAIQNPDETYTVYNNITLVDEGNKVVFDPSTGESITFTGWSYDYESRTYDLTLDGGGNMTVQFGNDSITMTQGDTVTNIFYVQDPADDPGTDNPDDPDNPGTDADVSGFFAWWKNAWNGFVDRLFTVLDGGDLEVILPGEEGNPEDEEDDGWTVFDLFALIRDALWKIITGVITVVLDGFLGLVDAIASLGDFFDIYDPANPDGIFGVPGGGVELWS